MHTGRVGLLIFAALCPLVACGQPHDPFGEWPKELLSQDDLCDALGGDAAQACATSLLQRKATALRLAAMPLESPGQGSDADDNVLSPFASDSVEEAKLRAALESRRGSDTDETADASRLSDTLQTKHNGTIMTGYHQTSPELCELILKTGFKLGHVGWCGGGIYFAETQEATFHKAIGPDSHMGCMLKATIDVGRMLHMYPYCDKVMTLHFLKSMRYDSITFNPGDGDEIVVYEPSRVLKIEKLWSYDVDRPSKGNACTDGLVGWVQRFAPSCLSACSRSCGTLRDAIRAYMTAGGMKGQPAAKEVVCTNQQQFSCMLQPANLPKCSGLITKAADFGFQLPSNMTDLESFCESAR